MLMNIGIPRFWSMNQGDLTHIMWPLVPIFTVLLKAVSFSKNCRNIKEFLD